ncbi:SRPBCC family protein [Parafrankia sp. BMG5.11]|uniref:SRPBCC family protein n=1 Tax=Parafrankia sp. BMG5.11 TaxID=222540 RepID=UPI00103A0604|nr:SRPBCC family protein [Parafrankia sp. BMG5.11]TCJ37950.1 carbon monoxide dehydrogenase [Parafrankia sp. BMG5.11]CAI7976223.1 Carbon monoxide dehydrogenase [Frankia sp. Hr75.2]
MELTNEFRVAVPIDRAWDVLTDLELIAPCMPGAELLSVEGEEYRGAVKVKVGPITAQYKGKATFQEKDHAAHRAVIRADGRETRGQGNASAVITATLTEDGDATAVRLSTDLTISGKAAQFGRGVLADVSAKLLRQFVQCLESNVLSAAPASVPDSAPDDTPVAAADVPAPHQEAATRPAPRPAGGDITAARAEARGQEPVPVNLLGTIAVPVAKRMAPVAAVLVVALWLIRRAGRPRR